MSNQQRNARRSSEIAVYTADHPLTRPLEFLRTAWADVWRSRSLAVEMAKRDIRSACRQSLLGVVLIPLPSIAIVGIGMMFKHARVLNVASLDIPYELFVIFGVMLWTTFLEALYSPISGLLAEQRLIARTACPAEAIVLGKLGSVLFNFGIKIVIMALAMTWFGIAPSAALIPAFIGVVALIALGTAFGLLLTPINLLYRDVSKILMSATTFWMFVTPVLYTGPDEGPIRVLMDVNPVTMLLDGTRDLATSGGVDNPVAWVVAIAITFLFLAISWVYLRVMLPVAVEQVNS